ncbi:MAG: flagellar hook-length control protein FliK [Lachnospiraceae bacterium]|nr:flagellar hook-length control protein FliK [Lachnospiraceae bacterium]
MQIGHRILGSYDTQIQENVKTENNQTAEQSNQAKSSVDISRLKEGAVFKGEVLNILGEKVTIALENKAQLFARLQPGVELGVGDQLLFSVKENNASQILIKPMFDSLYSAQTQVLEKALDMAGLSPTEKNFSAAKELMEAGLPIDKGNMVKLLSQSMKFEGTSMQTLVALNKMNIPVTEANIAQYERYQNYSHQLAGDISQAANAMAAFSGAVPDGASANTLLSLADQVLDIFMPETSEEDNADVAAGTEQVAEDAKGEGTASVNTAVQGKEGAVTAHEIIAQQEKSESVKADIPVNELQKDIEKQAETGTSIAQKTGLTKGEVSNLYNLLAKAGISDEQIQMTLNRSNSQEELLKNMIQTLSASGSSETAIRNILDSNEFKKLFSDVIKKNWSLNPKDMKDAKEIEDLYNKILKQGKAFEDAVSSKGGDAKNFNQNFQNMRQNMQFMEQLNNQMIYAQMPLKLSNQNANSELYVYADKRKLMEKKDGISVMLHLDMDHLGTTDVKVTLTGTNVNARFYLNDQQSVDIVTDNMEQLARQLADRGFSLTNEVVKRQPQDSINKVVDEIIDENAERSIKRYTFDARM